MAKIKAQKGGNSTCLIILVIILAGLNFFQYYYFNTIKSQDILMQVSDITANNGTAYLGKTVTVEGYYIRARNATPMLITSIDDFLQNTDIPSARCIYITGQIPSELSGQFGSRITVKGQVAIHDVDADGKVLIGLDYRKWTLVEAGNPAYSDDVVGVEINYSTMQVTNKYAILISGGINSTKAYTRYWNDINYMYCILVVKYHYDPKNIIVIYKDGIGDTIGVGQTPVNFSCTKANLHTAFDIMATKVTERDQLFIYTTNHGGSGGLSLYYYEGIGHTEFATMVNNITCGKMIIVMEQCVSGKFISYLSKANRIIMTAANETESSWGCDTEGAFDEFLYHFMSAVYTSTLSTYENILSIVDTSWDGKVSMVEAFNYARMMDSRAKHPHYDDNADGAGTESNLPNGDGALGASTFL